MSASLFSFLGGVTGGYNAMKAAEADLAAKKELKADEIKQRMKLSALTLRLEQQFKGFEYKIELLNQELTYQGTEPGRRKVIREQIAAVIEQQRQLQQSLVSGDPDVTGGAVTPSNDDYVSGVTAVAPKAVGGVSSEVDDNDFLTDISGRPIPRDATTLINPDGTNK